MKLFLVILTVTMICLPVTNSKKKPSKTERSIQEVKADVREYEAQIENLFLSLRETEDEIAQLTLQITVDYQSFITSLPSTLIVTQYFINKLRPEANENVSTLFSEILNISNNIEHRDTVLSAVLPLQQNIAYVLSVINNRTVVTDATIESCGRFKPQKEVSKCLDEIRDYYEDTIEKFTALYNDITQKIVNFKNRVDEYISGVTKCMTLLNEIYADAGITTNDIQIDLSNTLASLKNTMVINRLEYYRYYTSIVVSETIQRDYENRVDYHDYVIETLKNIVYDAVYFTIAQNFTFTYQQQLSDANSLYLQTYNGVYRTWYTSYLPGRADQIASEATSLHYAIDGHTFDYSLCSDNTVYVFAVCILNFYKATDALVDRYVALQNSYDVLVKVELAQRTTYAYTVYYEYRNKTIPLVESVFKNHEFTYQNFIDYLSPMINRAYTDAKNRINSCVAQNVGRYYIKLNATFNAITDVLNNVTKKYAALNDSVVVGVTQTLIHNLTTTLYDKSKSLIDTFVDYTGYLQQINDDYTAIQNSDCNSVSSSLVESFVCIDEKKLLFADKAYRLSTTYCDKFVFDPTSGGEGEVDPEEPFYYAYDYVAVDIRTARAALSAYQNVVNVFNCLLSLLQSYYFIHHRDPSYIKLDVYSCNRYI